MEGGFWGVVVVLRWPSPLRTTLFSLRTLYCVWRTYMYVLFEVLHSQLRFESSLSLSSLSFLDHFSRA